MKSRSINWRAQAALQPSLESGTNGELRILTVSTASTPNEIVRLVHVVERRLIRNLWLCATVLWLPLSANGAVTLFSGFDPAAGPSSPRPNANAAAAAFDSAASALGAIALKNLENLTASNATTIVVDPMLNFQFANHSTGYQTIRDADFDSANGYNTTVGGNKWALIYPEISSVATQLDFLFSTPIQAWGTYHTGLGSIPASVSIEFFDGTSNSFPLSGGATGGAGFFGFTDSGRSISKVSWVVRPNPTSGDSIGIDDTRYVLVPEPSTLLLLGIGAINLLSSQRTPRRKVA
jgi:PEP-CTERM motif